MRKCGAEAGKESCTIVNMVCIRLMCLKKTSSVSLLRYNFAKCDAEC